MIHESRKAWAIAIRSILDEVMNGIGAMDEASFNAAAATINAKAAAIRVYIEDADYVRGDIRIDPADGIPYWAMHDHGVSSGQIHRPSLSPTIWTHCHGTTMETARAFISEGHNPYMAGHYCVEDGIYRCKHDNVVYPPSLYPSAWEKCE